MITEESWNNGLVSRVKNIHSKKKYVISTAQEIKKDYWSIGVFPGILFGFLPNLKKPLAVIIRNNKDDAHDAHWKAKKIITNTIEDMWALKLPNPTPPEGFSPDAQKKIKGKDLS